MQLGSVQKRIVVAAPAYFRHRAEPRTIEDLLDHNCIRQRSSFGGRMFDWKFRVRRQMVQIDDFMRAAAQSGRTHPGSPA